MSMHGRDSLKARRATPRRLKPKGVESRKDDRASDQVTSLVEAQDVTGLVRLAFERDRPQAVLNGLLGVAEAKESEIESICKDYSDDFVSSVDELHLVKSDAQELKRQVVEQNQQVQSAGEEILRKIQELQDCSGAHGSLRDAASALSYCRGVLEMCQQVRRHIEGGSFHQALTLIGTLRATHLHTMPWEVLRRYLEVQLPACTQEVERRAAAQFYDWLAAVRERSRTVGRAAIAAASQRRQEEEMLRQAQREAEADLRSGRCSSLDQRARDTAGRTSDVEGGVADVDLTAIYHCQHLYRCLGQSETLRFFYLENRQRQLQSDLEWVNGQDFLETYQDYFSQVAGFFAVEEKVLRTARELTTREAVDSLWEGAVDLMKGVLDLHLLGAPSAMLLVKDFVSLLCEGLQYFGYVVSPLREVMLGFTDRYHELLFADARRQLDAMLMDDNLQPMTVTGAAELRAVLAELGLREAVAAADGEETLGDGGDGAPPTAFPCSLAFSRSVVGISRLVRGLVEDSVNFVSRDGVEDLLGSARRHRDRMLSSVVHGAVAGQLEKDVSIPQAMQLAANNSALVHVVLALSTYTTRLCRSPFSVLASGVSDGIGTSEWGDGPGSPLHMFHQLEASAHQLVLRMATAPVDTYVQSLREGGGLTWAPDSAPVAPTREADHLVEELERILDLAELRMPEETCSSLHESVFRHLSTELMEALASDCIKSFNTYGVLALAKEIACIDLFLVRRKSPSLERCLDEPRQFCMLIISNKPERILDSEARAAEYGQLQLRRLGVILEKYCEPRGVGSILSFSRSSATDTDFPRRKHVEDVARRVKGV